MAYGAGVLLLVNRKRLFNLEPLSVNYPIEIVVWEDFTASAHWQTPKEVAASMPAICTTIGFLVHENRNTIKLCNSVIQGEDVVGGESLIIKKNIISRERVEFI